MFGFGFYRLQFSPFPAFIFYRLESSFQFALCKFGFLFVSVSSSTKILFHFFESLKLASRFFGCALVSKGFDWFCFAALVFVRGRLSSLSRHGFLGSRNRRVLFSAFVLAN